MVSDVADENIVPHFLLEYCTDCTVSGPRDETESLVLGPKGLLSLRYARQGQAVKRSRPCPTSQVRAC